MSNPEFNVWTYYAVLSKLIRLENATVDIERHAIGIGSDYPVVGHYVMRISSIILKKRSREFRPITNVTSTVIIIVIIIPHTYHKKTTRENRGECRRNIL